MNPKLSYAAKDKIQSFKKPIIFCSIHFFRNAITHAKVQMKKAF